VIKNKFLLLITIVFVTIVIIGMLSLLGYIWYIVSDHSNHVFEPTDTVKGR
jgi:hypothetical protein